MGNKMKSFASAIALGFALLVLGPSTSTAQAEPLRRHGSFRGHAVAHRSFAPIRHRAFARSFHAFAPRAFFGRSRPFRLVRVRVFDPFPRWTFRRVYYSVPYTGAYCNPY